MKKYLKLFFIFLILFSIKNVYAANLKIGLKEVKGLGSTEFPYIYNNGKTSIEFQSVQSMAITKKHIVIMMSKTVNSSAKQYKDLLLVYDKSSFKKVKEVLYNKDVTNCGHANGLTYDSKKNQLVCADNARHRFVIYNADNFNYVKTISFPKVSDNNYSSYNNISYDSDDNVFWAAKTSGDRIDKFDSNLNKTGTLNIDSSQSYFDKDTKFEINQESCYYRGRLYLVNYVGRGKESIAKYKPSLKNVANNDMIIYSYGLKGSEKGKKGNLIYNQKSKDSGHNNVQDDGDLFREVEALEFNGNTAYILFQRGGRFQVYNVVVGNNDINAKVVAKVSTNNKTLFKKLNMKANFKSKTDGFKYDKSIAYDKNYEVKNISISKYGKYKMNIKQNKINSSNWDIDNNTIESTIEAYYDFNINKTNYNVSYKNANNTFKNTFTYTKISVPISVSANLSKLDAGATLPNLSASLYNKDGKKMATVSMNKDKYKFTNLSYKEPGTYTYTIKQNIPTSTTSGVYTYSFDKKEVKVTVKVTASDGKLKYKVKYSKSGFDNKVTTHYNECLVNNTINIQSIKNDDFNTPTTKLNIVRNSKLVKVVESSSDKYNFVLTIKSPGVYKYELSQDTTVTGSGNINYQYDTKKITLTITAKIVNNQLVCSSKLSSNSLKNKFVITYGAVNAVVSVGINSTNNSSVAVPTTNAVLSGNGIKETISSYNNKYEHSISLKKTGTYKYTMVQKNISLNDVDCDIDDTKITITIVVSKNNGTLNYTISYSKNHYNNIYTDNVDPINLMFSVNIKTNIDDENVSVPVTQAKLYDNNNVEKKTVSSSKGRYVFKEIRIEEEGTYTFKIKQVVGLNSGNSAVTYELDEKEIVIRAVVTNVNGTLKANTIYSSGEFNNKVNVSYSAVNVNVVYNIDNNTSSDAIKNIDLSATVYNGTTVVKNVNEENNKYSFNLQFTAPGNYTYTIKQDNAGIRKSGMYTASIDNDVKTFIVHVTSDNLNLVASVEYQYTDNSFENDFVKTSEVLNIPISIRIDTSVLNDKAKVPVTQAVIEEKNDSDEYDTIEKVSSNNGVYTFTDVDVVTEGVYTYKISQVNSGEHKDEVYYYSIDQEEVFVQVNVFENSEGKLTYNIHDDDYIFENVVDIDYDPINIPISVNINTRNTDNLGYIPPKVLISDDNQVLEIKDGNVSNISFNNISINRQGKYNYKIFQSNPHSYNKDNIEYIIDDSIINVEVNVVADENNKLKYTVNYNSGTEIQTLTNEYRTTTQSDTVFVEPSVTIDIFSNSSEAKNINTKATLFDNNVPIYTVTNNNGSYTFDDLKLATPGKYKYTIRQVPYDDDKWELDSDELEVEIEVYKDEQNQLQYRVTYTNNVSSFTNLDDTVLKSTDEEDFVIDNFPNTGINMGKILFIIGLILIIVGSFVLHKNLKKYNES